MRKLNLELEAVVVLPVRVKINLLQRQGEAACEVLHLLELAVKLARSQRRAKSRKVMA